jgi:hypothetical protein
MRGRSCPEAWASLVPERVCPKVGAKPHQSCFSSLAEGRWKRGSAAQNPPYFSRRSRQYYDQSHFIKEFKRFTGFTPQHYTGIVNEFGRAFHATH